MAVKGTVAGLPASMVLRRPVGGAGVMHGQLQYLTNMAGRPRIDLRVIPFAIGANPGLNGPFMILEFADQPTLVHIDFRGASGLLEEAPVVRSVKLAWRELHAVALSADESARLVADIAGTLT